MRPTSLAALLAVLVVQSGPALAVAQETSIAGARASSARDALEAFETGTRAAEEERWSDALPAFQRAYALSRSDIALFNVGYVLRSLGRFVEARAAFNEVIARSGGAGELLDQARAYRDEVVGRIAHLRVDGLEDGLTYELLLDGTAREDDGARPVLLDLDPGDHGLGVRRDGFLPYDWAGHLSEGASERFRVELLPVPSGGTIADEPWFWILVTAVVVGGAVAIGFIADDAAQLDPAPGRTVVRL